MDKFAALRAYVTVVDEEGFAAAGRLLGLSRSAVNRLVIALEDDLGVQLLNRTTRQVAPTAVGLAFVDRAKAILDTLDAAEREVGAAQIEAVGQLRVNAPMSFGTLHLGPAIADFMAQHPDLRIELALNDRFVDIIEEGYDLAIRIAEPDEETTLVDFRLGEVRRVLCASPGFLERHGDPGHPDALKHLPCLNYGHLPTRQRWQLDGPEGRIDVGIGTVLCSNNGEVLRDAAVKGLGVALLPTFIVGPALQVGELVTVLHDYRPPTLLLTVIYPPSRHLAAKIRLFTDFLIKRFGDRPIWDLVG